MRSVTVILLSVGFTFCFFAVRAQDSTNVYKRIEELASKKKFIHFIYRAVFVEPKQEEYPVQPVEKQGEIINPFLAYQDKRITRVNVQVERPFGKRVNDTLHVAENWLQQGGNRLHVRTRKWVIENKLLFKEGQALDPLALAESERLLRQSAFATDARIFLRPLDSASVEVIVLVHDKWSITIPIEVTAHDLNADLRDQNFLGLGYTLEQYAGYKSSGYSNFAGSYSLQNVDNTYISSTVRYRTDRLGTETGIAFDRPFFSPLAVWAAGLAFSYSQHFYSYKDLQDGLEKKVNVTNGGGDIWAGRAIKILRDGKLLKQSHNLIVSGRYFNTQFFKRPFPAQELLDYNNNTWAALGSVGFALQQFYKDRYIYRFGANEDVPNGMIFKLVGGVQKKEYDLPRFYSGFELARAAHFRSGYFSATWSSGIFFNAAYTNDITTRVDVYYFSNLVKKDGWYLRQFANYDVIHGSHKMYGEKLRLGGGDLYGFDEGTMTGDTKMLLRLETVAYAPYDLLGFYVAPVFMAGYGMLGSAQKSVFRSTIYQAYSLGIMFRNENLLNSTFQVSFGLYPYDSGGSTYIFKYNPVTSFTVRVRPFAVGRPDFVNY